MSGYDRRGSSRDPPLDRGGYYARQGDRGFDGRGDTRGPDPNDNYHPQLRQDYAAYPPPQGRHPADAYPPRDGYGVGGPQRAEPEYGRFGPYDRGVDRPYGGPPPNDRYGGYDRRDTYDRGPVAPGLGRGPAPQSAYPAPPPQRDDGYGYVEDRVRGGGLSAHDGYGDRYEPQRRDQYPPRRDVMGGGRDQGYQDAGAYQADDNQGEVEHVLEVPAEVAKMVIGQGGVNIKSLQERTGAHVHIHKPEPGEPAGGLRVVKVRGDLRAVDAAVHELRGKLRDYDNGGTRGGAPGGGMNSYPGDDRGRQQQQQYDDRARGYPAGNYQAGNGYQGQGSHQQQQHTRPAHQVEVDVPCPSEHRGLIIGKGGARVFKLETETGCKIRTVRDHPFITLIGTKPAVDKAKSQIEMLLKLADLPPMPAGPEKDTPPAVEIVIPGEAIGKVMGLGGCNIKILQCQTQCYMVWDKLERVMRLWGSETIVGTGKAAIEGEIAEALALRDARAAAAFGRKTKEDSGNRVGAPGASSNNFQQIQQHHHAFSETIPTQGHGGLIIGKGGTNARSMTARTGAAIKVDRKKQEVTISGATKDIVTAGLTLVNDVIDKAVQSKTGGLGASPPAEAAPVELAAWTNIESADALDGLGEGKLGEDGEAIDAEAGKVGA